MQFATIPMAKTGPIRINNVEAGEDIIVPLATYETTLWHSVNRGAVISRACGGISAVVIDERMTRSVIVQTHSILTAANIQHDLRLHHQEMQEVTKQTGRFVELLDFQVQIVGNLLYIRFEFSTGDAAGHNMVTKAADQLINWLLKTYESLRYISISGNYCTDKKVSSINAIAGRGKKVIAELMIPRALCVKFLKTTPEKLVELNIKKNYIGSIAAGSLLSANAHFANMLLAFYLATGQDAANIVEGSQGIVSAEILGDDLYFAVTVPNIIVGTVGNGKHLDFVKQNLELMGCLSPKETGAGARRLAIICGAVILCGELSLLAAQTNIGELMAGHLHYERSNKENI